MATAENFFPRKKLFKKINRAVTPINKHIYRLLKINSPIVLTMDFTLKSTHGEQSSYCPTMSAQKIIKH